MATTYIPTSIQQGFNQEVALNQNFTDIKTALDEALTRLSSAANAMETDFDVAGNQILNIPSPTSPTDPVRLQDINSLQVPEVVLHLDFTASMSVPADTTTYAKVTMAGNATVAFTGTPNDGQGLLFAVRQDATGSRVLTFDAARIRESSDVQVNFSTAGDALDYFVFRYNADDDKFDLLAINRGF